MSKSKKGRTQADRDADLGRWLETLLDMLEVGETKVSFGADNVTFASGISVGEQAGNDYANIIINLGIVKREGPYYGTRANGLPSGRHYDWTLMVGGDEARERLAAFMKQARETTHANKVAGAKRRVHERQPDGKFVPIEKPVTEVTAAPVAGDSEEPLALIEAARKYATRDTAFEAQIATLAQTAASLGITFDADALRAQFEVPYDSQLETIGLVLPAIDDMSRTIERLTNQNHELLEKSREIDALRRENERLARWKDARVSADVLSTQAETYSAH